MKLSTPEKEFLSYLHSCDHMTCNMVDLLNHFLGKINPTDGRHIIYALKEKRLVSISLSDSVKCTDTGVAAVLYDKLPSKFTISQKLSWIKDHIPRNNSLLLELLKMVNSILALITKTR